MPMDWPPPRTPRQPAGAGGQLHIRTYKPTPRTVLIGLLALLAIVLAATSYYTVGPDESAVVLRLGRYNRLAGPGLHFKLPLGIEQAILVKTGRVFKEEFGFRTIAPGIRSRFTNRGYQDESLMLTGDLNVIDVKWIVQYRIRDPKAWLFGVRDPRAAIRDLSEAVMRRIVGNRYSDAVLTYERMEVAAQAQRELQRLLDRYGTGVAVVTLKLQDVNPPAPVQPAFNEVNEARQQRERMINEAQAAYNREIPKAIGEAARVISEAQGYATERVNRAKGEAARFLELLGAYRKAKDITAKRMYLEAMEELLKRAARVYVVDPKLKGLVPLLNISPAPKAPAKGGAK